MALLDTFVQTFLRTTKITFKKLSDNANNNDEGEYYAQKQDSFG